MCVHAKIAVGRTLWHKSPSFTLDSVTFHVTSRMRSGLNVPQSAVNCPALRPRLGLALCCAGPGSNPARARSVPHTFLEPRKRRGSQVGLDPKARPRPFSSGGAWAMRHLVGNGERVASATRVQCLFDSLWTGVGSDFCEV